MRETIERYRDLLVARLNVLEEEIRVAEALYKEGHGDFRFLTFENVAFFERQIHGIDRLRKRFETMDLEEVDTLEEFKAQILGGLEALRETCLILRPSVRMVMECVREL